MIHIIHGDDTVGSYKRFNQLLDELKLNHVEIEHLDSSALDATALRQKLSPDSLFGGEKCLTIRNLLSGIKSKNKDSLINTLLAEDHSHVIIYETKSLTVTALKNFTKAKIEKFDISPVIFKYLDLIRPGNFKMLLAGWNRLLELGHEPEYVFTMVVRQIRLIIQAKTGSTYLKLKPYPKKLVVSQAAPFDLIHLLDLHHELFRIDKKIKTGASTAGLESLFVHFLQKI